MGKRRIPQEGEERDAAKRLKLDPQQQGLLEIRAPEDLRHLLSFVQDDVPRLRLNLQKFQLFLEDASLEPAWDGNKSKCIILLDFLKSVTPAEDDHISDSLPDLIQAWSFASQVKNYGLLSAIPSALALLLRTVSAAVDFQVVGNRLCRTILKKDNLKLLDEGLGNVTTKDHLIIPCIQLLSEIVSFDGGSHARGIYNLRDVTFKRLDVFLGVRSSKEGLGRANEATSLRACTIDYILVNARFQDTTAKTDLLSQAKIARALFHDLAKDEAKAISNLLRTLKTHVLEDQGLPRIVKSRLLTDVNLKQIINLYSIDEDDAGKNDIGNPSASRSAHDFLMFACTSKRHGIAVKQNGWYPPGTEKERSRRNRSSFYDFSGKQETFEDYKSRVPVKNTLLASFLQDLRPWAHPQDKELATAIFKSSPELVADYFKRKHAFSFDPKLTTTWVGYCAFLFSVISLPLPVLETTAKGEPRSPPPASIAMESILPNNVEEKALRKCLNHSSELVKLLSIQLLIAAFRKLRDLISHLSSSEAPLRWSTWSAMLKTGFQNRLPDFSSVVNIYRSCRNDQSILRDASACLLTFYHTVAPQLTKGVKFDVSTYLTDVLAAEQTKDHASGNVLAPFEMTYLLEIASYSFESRLWHKSDKLPLSPFTTILKVMSHARENPNETVLDFLQQIVDEQNILQQYNSIPSLHTLLDSLNLCLGRGHDQVLFEFLDKCILRLVQRPVRYLGDAKKLAECLTVEGSISNLFMVMVEQWPFFTKEGQENEVVLVSEWISHFLRLSLASGECEPMLRSVGHQLALTARFSKAEAAINSACQMQQETRNGTAETGPVGEERSQTASANGIGKQHELDQTMRLLDQKLQVPPEPGEFPSLTSWHKKDVADAVEESELGNLTLYLSSQYEEIRRQALVQLQHLMAKLQYSDYSNRQQFYLLIGIIVHTAQSTVDAEPLPTIASVLAVSFTQILNNPLHFLYGKVNEFLNRSPIWIPSRLPLYWIDKVLLLPPELDDAHLKEVNWLLETLTQGLRNLSDLEIYRRSSVFERTMSLAASPRLPRACFESVIQLLYRSVLVGGATTLVTRYGVLGWIQEQRASKSSHTLLLQSLDRKVRERCDQNKVLSWSAGSETRF